MTLLHLRPPIDVKYAHHTLKNAPYSSQSIFEISTTGMLVKQGCDEYSFTWGISEEVHETTVGKRELHINRSMVTFKGSIRYWNYLETCTDSLPADSRQLLLLFKEKSEHT